MYFYGLFQTVVFLCILNTITFSDSIILSTVYSIIGVTCLSNKLLDASLTFTYFTYSTYYRYFIIYNYCYKDIF